MQLLILNIFIVILLGGFIAAFPESYKYKKQTFLIVSFIQLWFIHSMVDIFSVPDLYTYNAYFEQSSELSLLQSITRGVLDTKIEIGYVLFFRLVAYLTNNFQVFLAIYSFILLFLYYKIIHKESPYAFCSVLLLLVIPFNQSLFVIRQHMAVAIMLASFPLVRDRKLVKFLLVNVLAMLMHRTAMIFVLVYLIYGIQGKKTKFTLITIAGFMIFFFIAVAGYIGNRLGVYNSYLNSERGQNSTGIIISFTELVVVLFIMKGDVWKEGMNRFSFILLYLYFVFSCGGLGFNPTGRLSVYFTIGLIFLIPISMRYLKSVIVRYIYFIIVVSLYMVMAFRGSTATYIEYFELTPLFH